MEEEKQFARGKSFCDSIITEFCNTLEASGYHVGLYMSLSYLNNYVSESVKKRCTIWVAQYAPKCTYTGQYGVWQYYNKGSVSGINGNCDMDECYIDLPSIITKGDSNGYTEESASDSKEKTVDELVREVIEGKWGDGVDRKERLIASGYDYAAVQKQVNEVMLRTGKR